MIVTELRRRLPPDARLILAGCYANDDYTLPLGMSLLKHCNMFIHFHSDKFRIKHIDDPMQISSASNAALSARKHLSLVQEINKQMSQWSEVTISCDICFSLGFLRHSMDFVCDFCLGFLQLNIIV